MILYTILDKLKDRMHDSSITALFISPNMMEFYKEERDQWIPWEIRYSLREETRNKRISHANAIVGIILPSRIEDYRYWKTMWGFSIVEENIENRYIRLVPWYMVIKNITYYLEDAIIRRDEIPIIKKNI